MKSNYEGNYAWCMGPWFPARNKAITDGFTQAFVKEKDGRYRSLTNPQKFYNSNELIIYKSVHPDMGLILLLISSKDGSNKGTLIEYTNQY